MKSRAKVLIVTAAAAAVAVIGGSQFVDANDAPVVPSTGANLLSEDAITSDWCGYLTPHFTEGGLQPSVEATAVAMVTGKATPLEPSSLDAAETADDPDAAAAAGYLALLEGEPAVMKVDFAILRGAANQALRGEGISNSDDVLSAARGIDDFLDASCGSES